MHENASVAKAIEIPAKERCENNYGERYRAHYQNIGRQRTIIVSYLS